MKKNRIKIIVGAIMVLAIAFVILQSNVLRLFMLEDKGIYDNNKKIVASGDTYSYINQQGSIKGNHLEYEFTFSGMDTIWLIDAKEDSHLTITYDINMQRGDFKAVLIDSSNNIKIIAEGEDKDEKTFNLSKGMNRIKIVGRKAVGHVVMSLDGNNQLEINN